MSFRPSASPPSSLSKTPSLRHLKTLSPPMALRRHVAAAAAALLLLLLLHPLPLSSAAGPPTNPVDAAAMTDLSAALSAAKSLGWSPTTDPCSWTHVGCAGGRITSIQIGNQRLSGTLPSSLANLTQLQVFEIMSNQISGPVPSLPALSALNRLYLHDNLLSSLPSSFFAGLTSLSDVAIDNNPFALWSLSDANLQSCSSLSKFTAAATNLSGPIPDFLATSFPGLTTLSLAQNPMTGGIPAAFAEATSLQTLLLNGFAKGGGLTGRIDVVANMTSISVISLQANSFTGPIPDLSRLTSLTRLNLRDNFLTGPVPQSLTSLKSLEIVNLTNNALQGSLPVFDKSVAVDLNPSTQSFCRTDVGDCDPRVNVLLSIASDFGYPLEFARNWQGNNPCNQWMGITCAAGGDVTVVNFAKKGLNGTISPNFSLLPALQKIVLSGNNINGTIPDSLVGLKDLKLLDVSNNALWGPVPNFNKDVSVITDGNPNIGKDTPPSTPGAPKGGGSGNHLNKIVGGVVGGLCALLLIVSIGFCYRKRIRQCFGGHEKSSHTTVIHPHHSGTHLDMKPSLASLWKGGIGGIWSKSDSLTSSGPVEPPSLVISVQVLRNATDNFSEENILGRGGFATVYKGQIDGTLVAVKRMEPGAIESEGLSEFKSEISVLTKVRHRHLVSLLGYCLDGNEKLLVFEHMPQGTLSQHLFDWAKAGLKPLDWKRRLSIALDVARGVEYLHRMAHQSFIHRDLKPSNILLGDDMKAKVADFGLVRLAPDGHNCSIQTRLAGTFGYVAPEYAVTGRVTAKADVYSFGVILMELITGRRSLDETLPEENMHLVTWFRRMLINKDSFKKVIDHKIELDEEEGGTLASIITVAELAGHCCAREPYQRPDMGYAVNVLSSLAEMWKPVDDVDDNSTLSDMSLLRSVERWKGWDITNSMSSQSRDYGNTQTSTPGRPEAMPPNFNAAR